MILHMHSFPWCLQPMFQFLCCWTISRQHGLKSLAYSLLVANYCNDRQGRRHMG
jgi:hypothetical protein